MTTYWIAQSCGSTRYAKGYPRGDLTSRRFTDSEFKVNYLSLSDVSQTMLKSLHPLTFVLAEDSGQETLWPELAGGQYRYGLYYLPVAARVEHPRYHP